MKLIKKVLSLEIVLSLLIVCLSGVSLAGHIEKSSLNADNEVNRSKWAIFLYLCGSDLESDKGYATDNLAEFYNNGFPDDINVFIESGGTDYWFNTLMNPNYNERWLFSKDGIECIGQLPLSNMGEKDTFESFLSYARDYFEAEHKMILIWDHGGGTVNGACRDLNYPGSKTLSVTEMASAVKEVFGYNPDNPPIDIIGFDCCLMATVDVADAFEGAAHYLLASEEVIPGGGWNYDAIGRALENDPDISAEELGRQIIDGYFSKYITDEDDETNTLTISLTDLTKIEQLAEAYEEFGTDLVSSVYSNPDEYISISIIANDAENYGGNFRGSPTTNLTDLKDFASYFSEYLPSAKAVENAIDNCVVYLRNGDFRCNSGGLSFFFSYDGFVPELDTLQSEGIGHAFKSLYSTGIEGKIREGDRNYMVSVGLDPDNVPNVKNFTNLEITDTSVHMNSDGNYYCDFGEEVGTASVDAMAELYYLTDDGSSYFLGIDDEIISDYNEGIFINNYGGNWIRIGDYVGYSMISFDSNTYNIYAIPFVADPDGERKLCYLQRGYNFETGDWEDLGCIHSGSEPGSARAFYLDEGTEIGIVQYPWCEETQRYEATYIDKIVYSDDIFSFETALDGNYAMRFRLEDSQRNTLNSDVFYFSVENGEVFYDEEIIAA